MFLNITDTTGTTGNNDWFPTSVRDFVIVVVILVVSFFSFSFSFRSGVSAGIVPSCERTCILGVGDYACVM